MIERFKIGALVGQVPDLPRRVFQWQVRDLPHSAARWAATVCILALLIIPADAQALRNNDKRLNKQQKQELKQDLKAKGVPLPLPGSPLDRFLHMPPDERARALSQLPAERRAQLEERLRRIEELPPEQRAILERRYQVFVNLRPRRQEAVRMFIQRLRDLPPWQRKAILESKEAQTRFSAEELSLVRDILGFGELE